MLATLRNAHPWRELSATLLTCAIALSGCGEKTEPPPAEPATTATVQEPAEPAPVVTQTSWAPEALEELLAPIALYPDLLIGQILAASVNSQEVLDGGNWLLQNEGLTGGALEAAAQSVGFGPAMRALMHFPSVVDMMCQQIEWTRQLGSAFTSDQQAVLQAIQRLRAQAAAVGNLTSTPEQQVETITEADQVIIEVKPAEPEVVYVPEYDPEAVYTEYYGTGGYYGVYGARLLAFGVGVIIGRAIRDDWCYPFWGYGAIYLGPRPFYPPAYAYRPHYGGTFRPAVGYSPPPGYRHSHVNADVRVDRNVVANNARYYDRFANDRNLQRGATRSPLAGTRQAATRPAAPRPQPAQPRVTQAAGQESWRGQSTYAGQRDPVADEAFRQKSAEAAAFAQARRAAAASGTLPGGVHAPPANLSEVRNARVDRGYGDSTRVSSGDAGRVAAAREARDSTPITYGSKRTASRDNAFSGASREGNGSFERAASARGHASARQSGRVARGGGRGR
jgi:hypothetical protein